MCAHTCVCVCICVCLTIRACVFDSLFLCPQGGVAPLVRLLGSDLHDVLVNTVRCIKALCVHSPGNQTAVALAGGIPQLVELLTVRSGTLLNHE